MFSKHTAYLYSDIIYTMSNVQWTQSCNVRLQPLHRYTTYYVDVDAAYCNRRSSVVCLSLCQSAGVSQERERGKNGQTERDTVCGFGCADEPCKLLGLDGGADFPLRRGNFDGEMGGPM